MKNSNIVLNRQEELTAIAILMLRRMDTKLTPIDRIIFLRLLICYGGRKISIGNLKILADEIKVNWLTLKKALGVLIEKGLCEQNGKSVIRLNKALLPRQICYQRNGTSFDQQIDTLVKVEEGDVQVQESKVEKIVADKTEIKSTASKLVARYKRYDFLVHLFSLIFKVQISHKQKNVDQLLALNFKQWLILVNMVLSSDQNGIAFNVGTYELSKWTGMSRNALHRAIIELFNMGIIRSKLDGTLNSNLLQSVAPVYCLNLSASIWEDKCIYGNFYFVKFPQEYISIAQQAFNFIRRLSFVDQLSTESIPSDVVLSEFKSSSEEDYYRIIKSTLSDEIQEEFNFATKFERSFCKYIQLMTPSFRLGQSSLNTESANINRINFMLGYFIHSKICNSSDIEGWLNSPMPVSSMAWFSRYLTEIVLPEQHSILFQDEKKIHVTLQASQIIEESRAKILFAISKAILRGEVELIIKYGLYLENSSSHFNLTILPSQNSELCDRVYFSRYGTKEQAQKNSQDTFHTLEFKKISDHPVEYKIECKQLELTLEDQKRYGLFNFRTQ